MVFGILHMFKRRLGRLPKSVYDKLSGSLFWGAPLLFIVEGYLDIAMGIMLYYNRKKSEIAKTGDLIDFYLVIFFTGACIIVPFGGTAFLYINRREIRKEN